MFFGLMVICVLVSYMEDFDSESDYSKTVNRKHHTLLTGSFARHEEIDM